LSIVSCFKSVSKFIVYSNEDRDESWDGEKDEEELVEDKVDVLYLLSLDWRVDERRFLPFLIFEKAASNFGVKLSVSTSPPSSDTNCGNVEYITDRYPTFSHIGFGYRPSEPFNKRELSF